MRLKHEKEVEGFKEDIKKLSLSSRSFPAEPLDESTNTDKNKKELIRDSKELKSRDAAKNG